MKNIQKLVEKTLPYLIGASIGCFLMIVFYLIGFLSK